MEKSFSQPTAGDGCAMRTGGGTAERLHQPRGAEGQILQNQRCQHPLAALILKWLGDGHGLNRIRAGVGKHLRVLQLMEIVTRKRDGSWQFTIKTKQILLVVRFPFALLAECVSFWI